MFTKYHSPEPEIEKKITARQNFRHRLARGMKPRVLQSKLRTLNADSS